MIPPGSDPYTSKYQIGDEVLTNERGFTGTVMMIDFDPNEHRYLLDCHPGALGYYDWVKLRDETGQPKLYAANWLPESQLLGKIDVNTGELVPEA